MRPDNTGGGYTKCGSIQIADAHGKHACIKWKGHTSWNSDVGPYHFCKCGHMWLRDYVQDPLLAFGFN